MKSEIIIDNLIDSVISNHRATNYNKLQDADL